VKYNFKIVHSVNVVSVGRISQYRQQEMPITFKLIIKSLISVQDYIDTNECNTRLQVIYNNVTLQRQDQMFGLPV